jgi:tetratricopeptide (TPR) repeat protein
MNDDSNLLDDDIFEQIESLSEKANQLIDKGNFKKAIDNLNEALELLPDPKEKWEAYSWIVSTIGDAYFLQKNFSRSNDYFNNAYKCEECLDNPFILLRLGESYYELENHEKAKEFLLQAYMIEGEKIFKGEKKYFTWLKKNVKLN